MTMHFSLEEKVEALGLLEIDTNPLVIAELYQIHQTTKDERCRHFKYYKPNGDSFMCYSEKYLDETPIEQLITKMEAIIQMGR